MADTFEIDIPELKGLQKLVANAAKTFVDLTPLWNAFIRPDGSGLIPDEFTLEQSVRDAFANNGTSAYSSAHWVGYGSEPRYAAFKRAVGAGNRPLIWDGAPSPLMQTYLDKENSEHIEEVTKKGFKWGSSRSYAGLVSSGGGVQKWDNVTIPARPIVQVNKKAAQVLAKGLGRLVMSNFSGGALSRLGSFL